MEMAQAKLSTPRTHGCKQHAQPAQHAVYPCRPVPYCQNVTGIDVYNVQYIVYTLITGYRISMLVAHVNGAAAPIN